MIVTLTKAEKAKLEALETEYEKLIADCAAKIESLRSDDLDPDGSVEASINAKRLPEPTDLRPDPVEYDDDGTPIYSKEELDAYKATPEYQAYKEANDAANAELSAFYDKWEAAGGKEWKAARKRYLELIDELNQARRQLYSQFEKRRFAALKGDPAKVLKDAKSQVEQLIKNRYEQAKKDQEEGKQFSTYYLRVDGDKLYIDSATVIKDSDDLLKLHYDFFKDDDAATKEIRAIVLDVIASSPYTGSTGRLGALVNEGKGKAGYRTKAKAQESSIITNMPTGLALPTLPGYQYSVSFYEDHDTLAHLMTPLSPNIELRFSKGKIYIDNGGGGLREVSEMELENLVTKESIGYIDLPTLMVFYNIILYEFQQSGFKRLKDVHTVYIPDLLSYMGTDPRINKEDIARVKKIVESYHNMIGVYYTEDSKGNKRKNRYPVLNFEGDSEENNTISFSSPYLNHVINTIFKSAARRTSKNKLQKKKNGDPLLIANHSYLVDPSINKERNKAAVQNVFILVTGIEQAGGKGYHIAASTLIERNKQLAERLEADPQHRAQLLKRVFTKTWELLRSKTYLADKYKDIELPDPKDPAYIPTVKGLSSMVIEIKHKGKNKTE